MGNVIVDEPCHFISTEKRHRQEVSPDVMQQEVLSTTHEACGGKKEPRPNEACRSNDPLTKIVGSRGIHYLTL